MLAGSYFLESLQLGLCAAQLLVCSDPVERRLASLVRAPDLRTEDRDRDQVVDHEGHVHVVARVAPLYLLSLDDKQKKIRESEEEAGAVCEYVTGNGRYVGQRLHTRVDSCSCDYTWVHVC